MNKIVNLDLIRLVAEELAPYRHEDDPAAFWDSLDGETDVLGILDATLASDASDAALIDGIKALVGKMKQRLDRIEMRKDATRRAIGKLLTATGMRSAERPAGTVSVRPGIMSAHVYDPAAVPSQLCSVKTVTTPDKAAIKRLIEAGETVPGVELQRGADIVTVRVG